ncbi:MAG: tyrosine--tRNA ligase [Malacoplasma sp.]
MNFFDELNKRGIVSNFTNLEKVKKFFHDKNKVVYVGFDPSANSLHLGNYVMISLLRRLVDNGFKVIALVGGATGMIGDPSGKNSERNLLDSETIKSNIFYIKRQLEKYSGAEIFDNYSIYADMNILDFLRNIGKYININHVLEREIVKKRLETGISYTEFSYSIIQGYDFYWLYKNKDVCLQMGGSDQWANITAGVDYIRRVEGDDNEACGITINLLTKSDGAKFGKSEKGAIFLDKNLTSTYEFYQFLINQSDADIEKLLNFFSFKSLEEISDLVKKHFLDPKMRLAQNELANELVIRVHGNDELLRVKKISKAFFDNDIASLSFEDVKLAFSNKDQFIEIDKEIDIVSLLIDSNISKSKREARELIGSSSIYINEKLVNDENFLVKKSDSYGNKFSLIRKGKKNYFLVIWK